MANPKRGNQAWKSGGGGGGTVSRGGGPAWKKDETPLPGRGSRRVKQLALVAGLAVTVGLIAWLIWYLQPPPRAVLVVVGSNPADDAERLDAPLDFYGWLGGKQIIADAAARAGSEGGGKDRARAPELHPDNKGGNPLALPDEAGLGDWVNRLRPYNPIVIYVGLPTGTTPADGAVLFTGGRNRLPVKRLVEALKDGLPSKTKKVLVLDPGRHPANPVHGQLADDFTAKLKGLNGTIQACPNLVVLCGADAGQRGWESEELRTTAFAHHVLRGLQGEAATGSNRVISANDLYDFARGKTEEWTRDNRPAPQAPILLPEGPEGVGLAQSIDVALKPNTPATPAAAAPAFTVPDALLKLWQEHDELARMPINPASYTPRAWRRHRELLLRYELAVRAGETATVNKLTPALAVSAASIRRALDLPAFKAASNSLAFAQLVRNAATPLPDMSHIGFATDPKTPLPDSDDGRLAFAARLLQLLAGDGGATEQNGFPAGLNLTTGLLRKFPADSRPSEVHLPVMVQEFYTRVLPAPAPAPGEWAAAVALRRRAEEAALGLAPVGGSSPPATAFTERIAPLVKARVQAGDARRRAAEDRLFSSDPAAKKDITAAVEEARSHYAKAVAVTADARSAYEVRDRLLADLVFLNTWVAADAGRVAAHETRLVGLWKQLHAFSADLDALPQRAPQTRDVAAAEFDQFDDGVKALARRAADLSAEAAEVTDLFRADCVTHQADAALQSSWLPQQQLLATPLIPAEQRMRILAASRRISEDLRTKGRTQSGVSFAGTAAKRDPRVEGLALARLTRAALGTELMNASADAPAAALFKSEYIEGKLLELQTKTQGWEDPAAEVGAALAGHLKHLSENSPLPGNDPNPQTERFSRSALAFAPAADWEPASVNRRLRWRDLLVALADRTADDHWYDERYDPKAVANPKTAPGKYFAAAADRYLADAGLAVAGVPGVSAFATPTALAAKLGAEMLSAKELKPLQWTSDQRKSVRFEWVVPDNYPITGDAIGIRRFTDLKRLTVADAAANDTRPLLPVGRDPLVMAADLTVGTGEVFDADAVAGGVVYFRGQRPTQQLAIAVRRRPELVLADPLPDTQEKQVAFAVKAQSDIDPGRVAVLLDLSGSMKYVLKEEKVDPDWRTTNSRFSDAMNALPTLLGALPDGTPLRVRVFSDQGDEAMASRLVYGAGGQGDKPAAAKGRLKALVTDLSGLTPMYMTPLTKSILTAVREDFGQQAAGNRTLVVLTDGADEDEDDKNRTFPQRLARMGQLNNQLLKAFDGSNAQLLVIRFAQKQTDLALSDALFKDVPGQVYDATNVNELRRALLDAIRPKLKLVAGRDIPEGYPRAGHSSRMPGDEKTEGGDTRSELYWSPLVDRGQFVASANPAASKFEQDLFTEDGDRMIVGLSRHEDGKRIRIRRELYSDYFKNLADTIRFREDGRWVLTVPAAQINDGGAKPALRALTFLEKVPPHRLPDGPRPAPEESISQIRPRLLWWDVAPVSKTPAGDDKVHPHDATVTIRKRYAYPAPAWAIQTEDWPKDPDRRTEYLPARVRVWPLDGPAPTKNFNCQLGGPYEEIAGDGDPLVVNVACEDFPIGPKGTVQSCLVVRVNHPKDKPVMVKYLNSQDTNAEHRYYRKADSYTAIFGPFSKESLATTVLKFQVTSLDPLIKDQKSAITLTPPRPHTGRTQEFDYQPGRPVVKK